jgi:hypothetical protein
MVQGVESRKTDYTSRSVGRPMLVDELKATNLAFVRIVNVLLGARYIRQGGSTGC